MTDPHDLIHNLSPEDAHAILRQLAARDEKLAAEIAALITADLSDVDIDGVAEELRSQLEWLTPEDEWERSGDTRDGYVETNEAAYGLIKEIVEPFLNELRQCQKAGLFQEAEMMCLGLLLGFYQFEYEVEREFKNWAPDASLEFAREVVRTWRKSVTPGEDISEMLAFIQKEMPHWVSSLQPIVEGKSDW
jgi:oligoribonuclease (3'-5' exoribonuclease)